MDGAGRSLAFLMVRSTMRCGHYIPFFRFHLFVAFCDAAGVLAISHPTIVLRVAPCELGVSGRGGHSHACSSNECARGR